MQKTLFSILVLLVCISHPSKATSFIYNVTDYGVKAKEDPRQLPYRKLLTYVPQMEEARYVYLQVLISVEHYF